MGIGRIDKGWYTPEVFKIEEIGRSSQHLKYWLSERSSLRGNSLLPKQYKKNEDVKRKIGVKYWEKIEGQRKKKERKDDWRKGKNVRRKEGKMNAKDWLKRRETKF